MNPSMASAEIDDRTCRREQNISRRFGFNKYLKGNLLDLMETNPDRIPNDLQLARSVQNIQEISNMADEADWVVLAHGVLPARFRQATTDVYEVLRASGKPVGCFQFNDDGSPSHTRVLQNLNLDVDLEDTRIVL